jgi:hypothetical protein
MPVTSGDKTYENNTIPDSWDDYYAGQNIVKNGTVNETQEFHLIINGKDKSKSVSEKTYDISVVFGCDASCDVEEVEEEVEEDILNSILYWSDHSNWPNETLPVEGDDVEIKSGWNMILDIEETPVFENITINGRL